MYATVDPVASTPTEPQTMWVTVSTEDLGPPATIVAVADPERARDVVKAWILHLMHGWIAIFG